MISLLFLGLLLDKSLEVNTVIVISVMTLAQSKLLYFHDLVVGVK